MTMYPKTCIKLKFFLRRNSLPPKNLQKVAKLAYVFHHISVVRFSAIYRGRIVCAHQMGPRKGFFRVRFVASRMVLILPMTTEAGLLRVLVGPARASLGALQRLF